MKYVILLVGLIVATSLSAQDHLWPALSEQGAGVSHDNTAEIVATVFKEAFQNNVRVRALGESAFMPTEDMVFVKQTKNIYSIVYLHTNVLLVSYSSANWMRGLRPSSLDPSDYHRIRPTRCEAIIPSSLASKITNIWQEMLLETRYERNPRIGVDGGWIEFSMIYDNRELAGRIWSPDDNTKPGLLVGVAGLMQDYCTKPNKQSFSRLEQKVSDLQRRVNFDIAK